MGGMCVCVCVCVCGRARASNISVKFSVICNV